MVSSIKGVTGEHLHFSLFGFGLTLFSHFSKTLFLWWPLVFCPFSPYSGDPTDTDYTAVGCAITTISSNLTEMSKGVKLLAALMEDDVGGGNDLMKAARTLAGAVSDLLKAVEPASGEVSTGNSNPEIMIPSLIKTCQIQLLVEFSVFLYTDHFSIISICMAILSVSSHFAPENGNSECSFLPFPLSVYCISDHILKSNMTNKVWMT